MVEPGRIPGQYNIVRKGEYEEADHRVPVSAFLDHLREDEVPDEVSVTGLGGAFEDPDFIDSLSEAMEQRANDLEFQNPMVQFVVEGTISWKERDRFELSTEDGVYELRRVFGPDIERRDAGWLSSPF